MRVCPKCGHIEDARWRPDVWRWEKDYCTLTDFRDMHSQLAQKLSKGVPIVTDDSFAYRLRGKKKTHVERVWVKLYESGGKSAFRLHSSEQFYHFFDPLQTKLFEAKANP